MMTLAEASGYKYAILWDDYETLYEEYEKVSRKQEEYIILVYEWMHYASSLERKISDMESKL